MVHTWGKIYVSSFYSQAWKGRQNTERGWGGVGSGKLEGVAQWNLRTLGWVNWGRRQDKQTCASQFRSGTDLFVIKTFDLSSSGADRDATDEGFWATFLIVPLGTS